MKRVLRITHFDKDKKARALELSFDPATTNDKGYSQDGNLLISIHGEQRAAFQLSVAEAALLKERLDFALALLAKQYMEMDEKASKTRERQKKDQKQNKNEGKENEVDWEEVEDQ